MQKTLHSLVLLVLVAVLALEFYLLAGRILVPREVLMPLVLAVAGVAALFFRGERGVSMVLGSFLVSFSTAMSGLSWGELRILLPGIWGRVADFLWTGTLCAMPFLFLHLSLIFPVRSQLLSRRRWLVLVFYGAPVLLATAGQLDRLTWLIDPFVLLFPLGLLGGTAIFALQYFHHLTRAEKQRLRLLLIGCLAGIMPRLLFLLARESLPIEANQLSLILLPLFPICLLLASQPSSPGEWAPGLQRLFGWGVGMSVWIAVGFFLFVLQVLLLPGLPLLLGLLLAVTTSLLLVWPLGNIALAYLSEEVRWSRSVKSESIDFAPIYPNPFIVGNPVRDPSMFYGRRAEFQFLQQTLRSQSEGSAIVLCGERRTGKTSILWQILQGRLGAPFRPVFLDLQGMVAQGDEEFLQLIRHECEKSLGRNLPGQRTGNPPTAAAELLEFLASVAGSRPEIRLLLLVDEYELIDERIQSGRLSPDFPRFLNGLLEGVRGLSFIFTGSQPLQGRTSWDELLGKSFYREISFLSPEDARELIREPLAGKVHLEAPALALLVRLSAGHPYFTQLLGQNLVDTVNESRDPLVNLDTAELVVNRVLEHPPPHLIYLWGERNLDEKLILAALASLIAKPAQFVSWKRVRRALASVADDRVRHLDDTRTRILLEQLRQRRLLDRDQERYRFRMDLLRRWLVAEETLWSVLSKEEVGRGVTREG